jgi:hypothetical protein
MQNSKVKLKGSSNLQSIFTHCRNELPIEAIRLIKDWDFIQKSPYSLSLYDKPKDWNDALPDTIRIADHWNFESQGKMHCQTHGEVPNNTHWCIAIFDDTIKRFIPILIIEKRPKTKLEQIETDLIFLHINYNAALKRLNNEKDSIKIELSFLNRKYKILEEI